MGVIIYIAQSQTNDIVTELTLSSDQTAKVELLSSILDRQRVMSYWILLVSVLVAVVAGGFGTVSSRSARKYSHVFKEFSEKTASLNIMEKMLQSMDAQILITELDTDNIIFINEKMEKAFGLTGSVKGKKCWECFQLGFSGRCDFCPKNKPEFISGEPVFWEEKNQITGRHYRIISRIIDWPDGSKAYMQQRDDVTELVDLIAKERETDKLIKLMIDTSPNGIIILDENFNCLDCNHEAVDMFGLSDKKEYRDKHLEFSPLYQPNGERSDDLRRKHLETAFKKGYDRFEWMHISLGGELVPCNIILVRSMHKNKSIVIAHMQDLRELKKSIELKAVMDRMREADEYAQL
ncbi:MAG: PAS domain-containing protein, partial [Synergistaceae bacterium]|nr:PAS domain-containing protein [Synergistaceae bacterium]